MTPVDTFASGITTKEFATKKASMNLGFKMGPYNIGGNITLAVKNPKVKYDISVGWWPIPLILYPKIDYLQFVLPIEKSENITISVEGKKEFFKKEYEESRGVTIPVFSLAGVVTGKVNFDLVFELDCELTLTSKVLTTYTVTYQNGKGTTTKESKELTPAQVTAEGKIKIGPEVSFAISIGIAGLDAFKVLKLKVGIYLNIRAKLTQTGVQGTIKVKKCVEISTNISLKASGEVGLIEFLGFLTLSAKLSKEWTLAEGPKIHIEDGKFIKTCTLKNRIVAFVNQGVGQEQLYNVNEVIRLPSVPNRAGYKLEGWYINTERSGLPGSDYKVYYDTVVPYCGLLPW